MNAGEDTIRCNIPGHVGTHLKGILVGIFVACRVKNCQHLNRPRHAKEKRGYRSDADASQLDTDCRPAVDLVDGRFFVSSNESDRFGHRSWNHITLIRPRVLRGGSAPSCINWCRNFSLIFLSILVCRDFGIGLTLFYCISLFSCFGILT